MSYIGTKRDTYNHCLFSDKLLKMALFQLGWPRVVECKTDTVQQIKWKNKKVLHLKLSSSYFKFTYLHPNQGAVHRLMMWFINLKKRLFNLISDSTKNAILPKTFDKTLNEHSKLRYKISIFCKFLILKIAFQKKCFWNELNLMYFLILKSLTEP